MGTDIHGMIQKKNKQGKWEIAEDNFLSLRHYSLFSVMGNVRNGYGFAGVKTYDPLPYIQDCRGLPDDVELNQNDYVVGTEYIDEYGDDSGVWMGEHSYGWFSLKEALEFDWNKSISISGYVQMNEYLNTIKEKRNPKEWSGGICGRNVVKISESQLTDDMIKQSNPNMHIYMTWENHFSDEFKLFLKQLDDLKTKYKYHDEIRFVFGFDS